MNSQETAAVYDLIAQHWNSESFNRENGIDQHRRALRFAAGRGGKAIDIGCGPNGRFIDLLLDWGYHVEGLDISEVMLAMARTRHPDVSFYRTDVVEWKPANRYDFISAWDSIWHVPLDLQEGVIRKLCAALNPGGILITSSGGVDEPGEVTNPCHGQPLYHAALGITKMLDVISDEGCACRHLEYDQPEGDGPGRHLCLIAQKQG